MQCGLMINVSTLKSLGTSVELQALLGTCSTRFSSEVVPPSCPVTLVCVEAEASIPGCASSPPWHPDASPLKIEMSPFTFYLLVDANVSLGMYRRWRVPLHFPPNVAFSINKTLW